MYTLNIYLRYFGNMFDIGSVSSFINEQKYTSNIVSDLLSILKSGHKNYILFFLYFY
jgi:hypothetical protein